LSNRYTRKIPQKEEYIKGIQPKPVKNLPPSKDFTNIITKYGHKETECIREVSNELSVNTYTRSIIPISVSRKPRVRRGKVRERCDDSYDVWECTYFKHLMELSKIFEEGMKLLGVETSTVDFLSVFFRFIRDCSSGEINQYIEEFSPETEYEYSEYYLKK
jgi:hypothetical protein